MAFGVLVAENCCLEEVVGAGVGGTEQWAGAELAEVELGCLLVSMLVTATWSEWAHVP